MIKKIFCFFITTLIIISLFAVPAFAYTPTNFEVEAEGAILVNMDTGDVLYSKNIDKQLFPASLTKIMTALLLYENCRDLDNEIITVSEHAIKSLQGTDSSVGGLKIGEELTARQMLNVLLLSSANDAANAIAEYVSGDIGSFADLMNAKAKDLGMTNTNYVNAHGLHSDQHYTTVHDMFKLTTAFLNISTLKDIAFSKKYTLAATNMSKERKYNTTNLLLLNDGQKCAAEKYKGQPYYYRYGNGVKTGYTDHAGRCLISTASKNGYNYLCILMNSPVYNKDHKKIRLEFGDTKALYEWAFNDFEYKVVLNTDEIIGEAPVDLSWDTDFVSVSPSEELSAIVPKIADKSTIKSEVKWLKDKFDAPIKQGDVLGSCDVLYAGQILGSVPVIATHNVKQSKLMLIGKKTQQFFNTIFRSSVFYIILSVVVLGIIIFIIICFVINSPKRRRKKY